jgi:hypothetical protein
MSEGFKRRFLTLERFMNELERVLVAGGTTSGHKTRALRHVLNYVTDTEMQANYVSAKELEAELLKVNFDNAKRANGAATTDDLLQLLRKARRVARSLRTKKV